MDAVKILSGRNSHGLITDHWNDHLLVGLLAQLVEHCIGTATALVLAFVLRQSFTDWLNENEHEYDIGKEFPLILFTVIAKHNFDTARRTHSM